MSKKSPKLSWCKARLGNDLNWWVTETSDKINWDVDCLSIIDPRQADHMTETLWGLKDYGLDEALTEESFFTFAIDSKIADDTVKLVRTKDAVFDTEGQLFLLPDNLDEDRSPYAEFLDHITLLQVKMLNDCLEFEVPLTIEDLEEQVRDKYQNDYMEGKAIHVFSEIMDILEYVPEGYSLEDDEEDGAKAEEEEETYDEIEDLPEDEENIEEDETMHWDEEEEEESEEEFSEFEDGEAEDLDEEEDERF